MQEVKTWKTNGTVIGSPVLTSAPHDKKVREEDILHTPFIRRNPEFVFSKHLRLTPEQSKDLFEFLIKNEQFLNELAVKDEIVTWQQLKDLFGKIAEYGRKEG